MKKISIKLIFNVFLLIVFQDQAAAQDARMNSISKLVVKVSNGIGVPALKNTNMKWVENDEVKILLQLTAYQRAAAIYALIDYTTHNEVTQLPFNSNDFATAAIGLGTRQISLAYISSITSQTNSDEQILHFIKSEIMDAHLTLEAQISYEQYFRSRVSRDEIRKSVIQKNKPIADQIKKIKSTNQNFIKDLAAKTTSLSLLQFCSANLDICASAP